LRKVTREELRAVYRSTALFVIPSLQEGLCEAGLEAMACGCPVVTSPCGGPECYVADGVNGYVAPLDREAFTAAVLRVVNSEEERSRLSREAQATMRRRFSLEVVEPAFRSALALVTAGRADALEPEERGGARLSGETL
jgi:glycosyltransferase involved in cell wall biosynthesis